MLLSQTFLLNLGEHQDCCDIDISEQLNSVSKPNIRRIGTQTYSRTKTNSKCAHKIMVYLTYSFISPTNGKEEKY